MRIAVLGANGRTGRLITAQAAERGHDVVAVVRRADAVVPTAAHITVALADGRDTAALAAAVRGTDAVVFAIGPSDAAADPQLMRESMAALLPALHAAGVHRLVQISADGPFRDSGDPMTRFIAKPIVGRILREGFADFVATEALVRASGLDWTIMRPPQLTDADSTRARTRRDKSSWFGIRVPRAAVASAALDALADPTAIGHSVSVAS